MDRYGAMTNVLIRLPGDTPLEECYRSCSEVVGCVRLFVQRGEEYMDLMAGRTGDDCFRSMNGPSIPTYPLTYAEVQDRIRKTYTWFEAAVPRSIAAITRIDWTPTGVSTGPVIDAISGLRTRFPRHHFLPSGGEPGDHLLMGSGCLAIDYRGNENLVSHRQEIELSLDVLKKFSEKVSNLMDAGVLVRLSSLESGPHPRPLEETTFTKAGLARAIRVNDSTLRRWGGRCPWYSKLGNGVYLSRGQIEELASSALEVGNAEKAGRLRALARV